MTHSLLERLVAALQVDTMPQKRQQTSAELSCQFLWTSAYLLAEMLSLGRCFKKTGQLSALGNTYTKEGLEVESALRMGFCACRSGMISDSNIVELQRLRRILEGKDPMGDMPGMSRMGSRLGSTMSSVNLMRGSVMAQSRLASVRVAAA